MSVNTVDVIDSEDGSDLGAHTISEPSSESITSPYIKIQVTQEFYDAWKVLPQGNLKICIMDIFDRVCRLSGETLQPVAVSREWINRNYSKRNKKTGTSVYQDAFAFLGRFMTKVMEHNRKEHKCARYVPNTNNFIWRTVRCEKLVRVRTAKQKRPQRNKLSNKELQEQVETQKKFHIQNGGKEEDFQASSKNRRLTTSYVNRPKVDRVNDTIDGLPLVEIDAVASQFCHLSYLLDYKHAFGLDADYDANVRKLQAIFRSKDPYQELATMYNDQKLSWQRSAKRDVIKKQLTQKMGAETLWWRQKTCFWKWFRRTFAYALNVIQLICQANSRRGERVLARMLQKEEAWYMNAVLYKNLLEEIPELKGKMIVRYDSFVLPMMYKEAVLKFLDKNSRVHFKVKPPTVEKLHIREVYAHQDVENFFEALNELKRAA